jgi:hypothetical protein
MMLRLTARVSLLILPLDAHAQEPTPPEVAMWTGIDPGFTSDALQRPPLPPPQPLLRRGDVPRQGGLQVQN